MTQRATDGISAVDVNRELYVKNAELAMRNKTLSLLHKIGNVALRTLETDQMVQEIVTALDDEFAYPFVAIGLCDGHDRHLAWKAFATCMPGAKDVLTLQDLHPVSLGSRTNICARSLATRHRRATSLMKNVFPDVPEDKVEAFVGVTKLKSVLVLPLLSDDKQDGVLAVGMQCLGKDLTRYERDLFQSLLSLVTIAVQKAETHARLQHTTRQLRVANRHLRELDELKTEFLSIASHQLRTPLAVLKGYTGMLLGGMLGDLQPKQHDTLGKMEAGTEQLIMLVNHLLDVSRIEANRLQVRLEPVDMRTVLDGLVKFIQGKAEEKKLTLRYVMPPQPLVAKVDLEKVKEVFMNLLDNAVKYTDRGTVEVRMRGDAGSVMVAIADTGHGLTPADKDKLFQKFATGSASKKVRTTTGLGLYVCRKLTEAMHGTITADSEGAEKGSTFTVTFPLTK